MLGVGPTDHDQGEAVVGRQRRPTTIWPDRDLETVHRKIGEVAVEAGLQGGLLVVPLGLDGRRDPGVGTVGPDDHARMRGDAVTVTVMAADPLDVAVLDDDLVDRESFANLGAGSSGGVDEERVEHGTARGVRNGAATGRQGGAGDGDRSEVERVRVDRGTARRDDLVEETPTPQCVHSWGVDEVGRDRVTGERRAIHHQYPIALAGQQHRGG